VPILQLRFRDKPFSITPYQTLFLYITLVCNQLCNIPGEFLFKPFHDNLRMRRLFRTLFAYYHTEDILEKRRRPFSIPRNVSPTCLLPSETDEVWMCRLNHAIAS